MGGWCPRGRRAEDGPIDAVYPLHETPSTEYTQRTSWNVRDSDATLVLTFAEPVGGTVWTIEEAARLERPLFVQKLGSHVDTALATDWLERVGVRVLNVAGPRESETPGIYAAARAFLERCLCA